MGTFQDNYKKTPITKLKCASPRKTPTQHWRLETRGTLLIEGKRVQSNKQPIYSIYPLQAVLKRKQKCRRIAQPNKSKIIMYKASATLRPPIDPHRTTVLVRAWCVNESMLTALHPPARLRQASQQAPSRQHKQHNNLTTNFLHKNYNNAVLSLPYCLTLNQRRPANRTRKKKRRVTPRGRHSHSRARLHNRQIIRQAT